jgi:hypothetical protein
VDGVDFESAKAGCLARLRVDERRLASHPRELGRVTALIGRVDGLSESAAELLPPEAVL